MAFFFFLDGEGREREIGWQYFLLLLLQYTEFRISQALTTKK